MNNGFECHKGANTKRTEASAAWGVGGKARGARGRGEHNPRPERATAAGERRADLPPAAKEKIHKTTESAVILCEKCLLISCVC